MKKNFLLVLGIMTLTGILGTPQETEATHLQDELQEWIENSHPNPEVGWPIPKREGWKKDLTRERLITEGFLVEFPLEIGEGFHSEKVGIHCPFY